MAKLVSVFISERYRRFVGFGIWLVTFAAVLAALAWHSTTRTHEAMRFEAGAAIAHYGQLRKNFVSTFEALRSEVMATPCSPRFIRQLEAVAFRPDGFNEFLHVRDGQVLCSLTSPEPGQQPVELGRPDIPPQRPGGVAFWLDRDLTFLGRPGLIGTIVVREPFGTVVPLQEVDLSAPSWMRLETVLALPGGNWRHRLGEEGIYGRAVKAGPAGDLGSLAKGRLHGNFCDPGGMHCVAVEANLLAMYAQQPGVVAIALLGAAFLASYATLQVQNLITGYWSFEARFRRYLGADSIVCAYQPVMCLETGEIAGCEVLARWRDIDDAIVYPDRFIPLVEKHRLTMQITKLVAERAYRELSRMLPAGEHLQVNFNIFPCDLDAPRLTSIYGGFLAEPHRFSVVVEIIESDEIPNTAQREIEALRRAGIKTYIDDFGTGYSNMQNLAALSVDGVKLDRAFAMAPDNSMMAQMLNHAVEMIHATGRILVVEGVETAERLAMLRRMKAGIDFVQGYLISRPLDIAEFVALLAAYRGGGSPARNRHAA